MTIPGDTDNAHLRQLLADQNARLYSAARDRDALLAGAHAVVRAAGSEVAEPWTPECDLDSQALHEALGALARAVDSTADPKPGPAPDPDELGRIVREEWVAWAKRQPNNFQHWLAAWEDYPEASRDLARRTGERLFAVGAAWASAPGLLREELEELLEVVAKAVPSSLPAAPSDLLPRVRSVAVALDDLRKDREANEATIRELRETNAHLSRRAEEAEGQVRAMREAATLPDGRTLGGLVREKILDTGAAVYGATGQRFNEACEDAARAVAQAVTLGAGGEAAEVVRLLREDVETALHHRRAVDLGGQTAGRGGPFGRCPQTALFELARRLGVEVSS